MLRLWQILVGLTLISGCAENSPPIVWPASVSSFLDFSESERGNIESTLHEMNERSPKRLFVFDGNSENKIDFRKSSVDSPRQNGFERAGSVILVNSICTIELSDFLFGEQWVETLRSVILHEVGHCHGLEHDTSPKEIMYPVSYPFNRYFDEAVDRFYDLLNQ